MLCLGFDHLGYDNLSLIVLVMMIELVCFVNKPFMLD